MNREIVHVTPPSRDVYRKPNLVRNIDLCCLEDCPINYNHYKGV